MKLGVLLPTVLQGNHQAKTLANVLNVNPYREYTFSGKRCSHKVLVQTLEYRGIPGYSRTGTGRTETGVWTTVSGSCSTGSSDSLCAPGLFIVIFVQLVG